MCSITINNIAGMKKIKMATVGSTSGNADAICGIANSTQVSMAAIPYTLNKINLRICDACIIGFRKPLLKCGMCARYA